MSVSELIRAELETNIGKLEKRGFPSAGKGAKYYLQLKFGQYGEVDLLGARWDKQSEMLVVNLYSIGDVSIGSKDIVPMTIKMGIVTTWLRDKKSIDVGDIEITGILIGTQMDCEGLLSMHLGGNVQFYTSNIDFYKGIEFHRNDCFTFDSIDIDIPIELPKKL